MDTFAAMSVFVQVARSQSFAAAARALCLSTSSVSRQVAELEAALGARLLQRTTRRVSLTDAGQRYLTRAGSLLAEVEALHRDIRDDNVALRGRLRMSAPPGLGDQVLAPLLVAFMQRHPALSATLEITERVADLVAEGFDAAVRVGALPDAASLTRRKLADLRFVACASPAYCAVRGWPAHPRDLSRHDCITWYYLTGGRTWRFREDDRTIGVEVQGRWSVNSVSAIRAGACAGFGVAALPEILIADDLAAGRLVPLLRDHPLVPEPVSIVWPRSSFEPRRLRLLVDAITTALSSAAEP